MALMDEQILAVARGAINRALEAGESHAMAKLTDEQLIKLGRSWMETRPDRDQSENAEATSLLRTMEEPARYQLGSNVTQFQSRAGMPLDGQPETAPNVASSREVRTLTPPEIESLRQEFKEADAWAKEQHRIDPELKHLGPPGGWPPEREEQND